MTNKHTPKLYATPIDYKGAPIPQVRFVEGGKEVASIVLSGHRIGEEQSSYDWAKTMVKAVNNHEKLVESLKSITQHFSDVMFNLQIRGTMKFENGIEGIPTIAKARALINEVEKGSE